MNSIPLNEEMRFLWVSRMRRESSNRSTSLFQASHVYNIRIRMYNTYTYKYTCKYTYIVASIVHIRASVFRNARWEIEWSTAFRLCLRDDQRRQFPLELPRRKLSKWTCNSCYRHSWWKLARVARLYSVHEHVRLMPVTNDRYWLLHNHPWPCLDVPSLRTSLSPFVHRASCFPQLGDSIATSAAPCFIPNHKFSRSLEAGHSFVFNKSISSFPSRIDKIGLPVSLAFYYTARCEYSADLFIFFHVYGAVRGQRSRIYQWTDDGEMFSWNTRHRYQRTCQAFKRDQSGARSGFAQRHGDESRNRMLSSRRPFVTICRHFGTLESQLFTTVATTGARASNRKAPPATPMSHSISNQSQLILQMRTLLLVRFLGRNM